MPPIRTYQDAPLHPDGITPQTAAPGEHLQSSPAAASVPTRTISQATDNAGPPPPQPGARPIPGPGPTSNAQPPPPMPGANPNYVPHSVTATVTTTTTSAVPTPPQLGMSLPTQDGGPTKSTQAVPPPPPIGQPTTVSFGPGTSQAEGSSPVASQRHSLEHPPGYQQNMYAQDGSAADRARLQAVAAEDADSGILGTLKNAATEAGKFLQKTEKDAWEWIENKR